VLTKRRDWLRAIEDEERVNETKKKKRIRESAPDQSEAGAMSVYRWH